MRLFEVICPVCYISLGHASVSAAASIEQQHIIKEHRP